MEEKRKRKWLPAAALAAVAVLGASVGFSATYGMWKDTGSLNGGIVSSGNLDVSAPGGWSYSNVDICGTATSSTTAYPLASGSKLYGYHEVKLALAGDNMVAKLSLTPDSSSDNDYLSVDSDYTRLIVDANGNGSVDSSDTVYTVSDLESKEWTPSELESMASEKVWVGMSVESSDQQFENGASADPNDANVSFSVTADLNQERG